MDIGTASVVWIDPPPDKIKEYWWNLWYNAKHGPERFRLPGVVAWRRFEIVPGAPEGMAIPDEYKYFTLSDRRDNEGGLSQVYKDLVATNYAEAEDPNTGEGIHMEARWVADTYEHLYSLDDSYDPPYTEYMLVVGHDVPAEREAAFDRWVREEYLTRLAGLPGYVAARHFRPAAGYTHPRHVHRSDRPSPQRLTLCDLESVEAEETGSLGDFGEPSGVERTKYQLYKRLFPYVGFKYTSTMTS